MTVAYLVRHAAHDRVGTTLCGRMPGVTLGNEGRAQAERLAERLAFSGVRAVRSSPRERATETAAPIARRLRLDVEEDADLDEIDFGDWTGERFDALDPDPVWRRWNEARASTRPPGGETMGEAQTRAARALDRAREIDGDVVMVGHADVIKAAIMGVMGLSLDAHDRLEISPASVSRVALWPDGAKLMSLNEGLDG